MFLKKIFFLLLFFCCLQVNSVIADEAVDLKYEIASLKADMKAMQASYEDRIAKLEQHLQAIDNRQSQGEQDVNTENQLSAYAKKTSQIELPEISVIVDTEVNFSDNELNANKNKVRVKEAELCFGGYLYPGVKGDFIGALEQEYEDDTVSTDVDVEEAYISFLNLPLGFQSSVGRKFLNFGRLNTIHPHHWAFTETPLVMQNFFGHHPWFDDGVELSWLMPADFYLKFSGGVWNGKQMGHVHSHSDEEVHSDFGEELIGWSGHVYTGRVFLDMPLSDNLSGSFGSSVALDDNSKNKLYGADFVLSYQWPNTYRRLKWHSEWFKLKENESEIHSYGLFSYLQFSIDKYWEAGLKYDWSEFADNDQVHAWANSVFLSYYFTHTLYLRGEYQYKKHASGKNENQFFLQLVWGVGPHSHRLED